MFVFEKSEKQLTKQNTMERAHGYTNPIDETTKIASKAMEWCFRYQAHQEHNFGHQYVSKSYYLKPSYFCIILNPETLRSFESTWSISMK